MKTSENSFYFLTTVPNIRVSVTMCFNQYLQTDSLVVWCRGNVLALINTVTGVMENWFVGRQIIWICGNYI